MIKRKDDTIIVEIVMRISWINMDMYAVLKPQTDVEVLVVALPIISRIRLKRTITYA
ncbi:MAG: hypothetical protein WC325_10875 [Candidatus Bathyarchaeia archaeon]